MKFTAEELMNIAMFEYNEAKFLKDGAAGFAQREGIAAWADASTEDDYESEEEVREEIRRFIAEEKNAELFDADKIEASTGKIFDVNVVRMYMDDEICEEIHGTTSSEQEFYEKYCERHTEKFGEDFIFETENPQI